VAIYRSINLLYPPFAEELSKGLVKARQAGYDLHVFETYRTPRRQDILFGQGRNGTTGQIVTNARGWHSWHQFGVAADVALFKDGKWSWDFSPEVISKFFSTPVIKWGGAKDGPHYEWAKLPYMHEARRIARDGDGLLAFWATLEM
jgi:peptidoglycan L-alanyl-D-glutamate endopeptidase CwlK